MNPINPDSDKDAQSPLNPLGYPNPAIKLANALGIGAHYWLGLETDYRAARARN